MAKANVSDEFDYEIWAPAAKTTLIEKGLWDVVENGVPPYPSKIIEARIQGGELSRWRDLVVKDMKAIQVLQSSLPASLFRKTLSPSSASAKVVWDLLEKGNVEKKVRRLEKQFEEISMGENESEDSYCDKVNEIVEQLRSLKIEKSEFEVMKKLLESVASPSGFCDGVVTLLKELKEEHNMNVQSLVRNLFSKGHGYETISEEVLLPIVKALRVKPKSESSSYDDEDVWMVSEFDTIHMTRYEKFFTALDRTHKAQVEWMDETLLMVEGKGDVKVIMKEGKKKTISNVLFVPGIDRNVLSISQLESRGYSFSEGERGECIIRDRTGAEFGETMWVGKESALRLRVVECEGKLTS